MAFSDDGSAIDEVETEVQVAFESLVAASRALDMDRYLEHFDREHFVGLNSDGRTWQSLAELEPLVRGGFATTEAVLELHFPTVKISVIDAVTAVLVNEFEQTLLMNDGTTVQIAGGGAQVWSKRSGAWKLVSVSASQAPQSE
ncbi:MAG: nuclear transport factor 2 family protein [Pseudomonadota bacterium]